MSRLKYLLPLLTVCVIFYMCRLASINGKTYALLPAYGDIFSGGYRNHEPANSKQEETIRVRNHEPANSSEEENIMIINHEPKNSKERETIMIQLRNRHFRYKTLYERFTARNKNPFPTCKFNRCKYLPRNTNIIPDVLIFHNYNPPELPAKRLPSQKYIFFSLECEDRQEPWQVKYNLTMTLRHDSDIPVPHFYVKKKEDRRKQMLVDNFNFATGKRKKIAWAASNCHARNEREIYVEELKKHIDIDIYGACGSLRCKQGIDCWSRINATYKFYLAFENTFCIDYYTEKVERTLSLGGMVPVVMGAAKYSEVLPPHSFIDVMDFASPRALAEYLHQLDNNDTLYNEYFAWQGHYEIVSYHHSFHCDLCAYLHTHRDETKVYNDIRKWYDPATRCRPGNWSKYDWS